MASIQQKGSYFKGYKQYCITFCIYDTFRDFAKLCNDYMVVSVVIGLLLDFSEKIRNVNVSLILTAMFSGFFCCLQSLIVSSLEGQFSFLCSK